jgi:ribosomal protein S12 methylthiotransferase
MERKPKVHVITLGCAKNLVDSESLLGQFRSNGVEIVRHVEDADVAIINTCGFIEASKAESINAILETAQLKSTGSLKKLFVMGCLSQRYPSELASELPEVDRFFGVNDQERLLTELHGDLKYNLLGERLLTTPSHYAYLKISEGCNHPCSFCAIPMMRGRHVSRPMDHVLAEARGLAERGVKELILIAQDTTYYGVDRSRKRELPALLQSLAEIDGIEWIRLMYAYPAMFPMELLDVIVDNPKVCRYIDMPVQHCADEVLQSMRRGTTRGDIENLIDRIRQKIPEIALRTTLIVGYPNEREDHFEELLEFVERVKFDRLGVFTYSQEDNTSADILGDPIPFEEKERRRSAVMDLQKAISRQQNESLVGGTVRILVDRKEGDIFVGRTEKDAPEVGNEVFIEAAEPLIPGNFYLGNIVDAVEYDLFVSVTDSSDKANSDAA